MKTPLLYWKIAISFLILPLLITTALFSQNKMNGFSNGSPWQIKPFERKAFIENKGQFENSLAPDKQNFNYCIDKGYQVFFYPNEISYRFTKYVKSKGTILNIFENEEKREAREHQLKTKTQTINVKWLNSNPDATIIVEGKQTTYFSYVINTKNEKPSTVMCDGYSKLTYKNLYDGIDVEYVFHPDNGIEYNLLIHPGADVSKVQMQYSGTNNFSRKGENVFIQTLAGDLIDHAPVTYYTNSKEKIASSFNINNNIVSFNLSPYLKDQEIVIDPWTVIPGFTPPLAFDNGVDNNGNIYIYGGGAGNFVVEKYSSAGGAPIWSLANSGIDQMYYGDMLVDGTGNFYLSEGFVANGAHTWKFSPTSSSLWQSTSDGNYREHWRLALNCITNKVIVAGGGTTSPTLNIAEIDVTTGTLLNAKSVYNGTQSDVAGLCVDELGKAYLKHSNPNVITYTDNANNTLTNLPDGYGLWEVGNSIMGANGFNFMALGGATFLFTSDGETIKKWDRNTYALLSSATIPGATALAGSGILADKCNNLFVGASNGVYRYDFNLVQKEYQPTTTAVFDIAYALNSDIVASGDGFLTPLPFGRTSCGADTVIITMDPCTPSINTVKVRPIQGIPPFSFLWDDGNTDSVRINLPLGNHIVTVRDGACSPSFFTDTVKVTLGNKALTIQKTNPLCNLSSNGEIKITLLKNQIITNVTWTPSITNSLLNDSTTKATGLTSGSYTCHLSSTSGCNYDTTIVLTDPPLLRDSLKSRKAKCPGDANGSAIAFPYGGTPPYTYSWNTNPIQTTKTAINLIVGSHIISITDSNSCVKTDSVIIGSNPLPAVGFTSLPVCFGDTTFLTNTSTVTTGGFSSFWLLGYNSISASTKNTKYVYPLCNNYMPTLIVTSDSGCVSTLTDTIVVYCKPTATFSVNNVCTYQAATFTNTSNGAISFSWDFDYNTGTDNTSFAPTHFYQPGVYNVQLIANSTFGCADTIAHSVTIYSKPTAGFTSNSACLGSAINFSDLSTINGGTITGWSWDSGDGSPLNTTQASSHTYTTPGTFPAVLIATSDNGCKDTVTKNVKVHPLPNPLFSATNVCDGASMQFNNSSTIPSTDTLQSYSWNFGDNSPLNSNQNPSHLYSGAGAYTIKLQAVSNFGCKDSISKTLKVNPNPVVLFAASDTAGCEPLCVDFQNSSVIATGSNVLMSWNLGDGSAISTSPAPSHCFANDSVFSSIMYSVSLTVTSDSGCVSALNKNNYITVYPTPIAGFTVQPSVASIIDPVVSLTNLSAGATSCKWNFGGSTPFNGDTSSLFNPFPHTYADTGSYVINLVVFNQYGCTDVDHHTVIIDPDFLFYVPNAFSPNGDGVNDSFTGKGIFIKNFEMRIFDRWGNVVYKTFDITKPWDGRANEGKEMAQQDVYVYAIKVTDTKGKDHNYKGTVTLVK